jgi:hypothetical protein
LVKITVVVVALESRLAVVMLFEDELEEEEGRDIRSIEVFSNRIAFACVSASVE